MLKFSANLSFLYPELPFLDRFGAAAADGFSVVEYASPYDHAPEQIAEMLQRHKLEQALFNLPAGDWEKGARGLGALPDRIEEFKDGVGVAIRYAQPLGCTRVNCLAGLAPEGASSARLESTLVDNLRYAARRLADAGIKLLIEPINTRDMPGFFVSTAAHAERILAAVGSDNLFIQYDVYHMQVMQGDLVPTFERLRDRIAHVQVADHPGRHEPGTGEINYRFVFAELDRLGYDGYVGCEYRPLRGTTEGLGWISLLARNGF